MATAVLLNEVEVEVDNPQSGARSATVGRAMAATPSEARRACEVQNASVCELAHYRDVAAEDGAPRDGAAPRWTWVRIPSGRAGATIVGAATQLTGREGGVSTLAVAAPYLDHVFGDDAPASLTVLCCPRGVGAAPR
jgi:hypothetical protein